MKLQVLFLAGLGLVAALAAAVLVGTMKADGSGKRVEEVQVVVASRALAATTPVDADAVTVKSVAKTLAPADCISDPVQIIGQVLTVSMMEGQAFTTNCFAPEGSGYHIASTLPMGMRAMSVSLADYSRLHGLLYPGSVVDVLTSFKVTSRDGRGTDVVSITLLRGIEVLAVEDKTVTKTEDKPEKSGSGLYDRRKRVTLMVNSKQAEALQVAMENGEISLALRNPRDTTPVDDKVTRLSDLSKELKRLFSEPTPAPKPAAKGGGIMGALMAGFASIPKAPPKLATETKPEPKPEAKAEVAPAPAAPEVKPARPAWMMRVIKGGTGTDKTFEPDGGPDLAAPAPQKP